MYDRGVVFINTSPVEVWSEGHIPGTIHLTMARSKDPANRRLKEATLLEIVEKADEVVFYGGDIDDLSQSAGRASGKALTWGFTRVYYFAGGLRDWHEAGFPIETSQ
jgi:3-mercaptopyruvate sulfurtransferase SseA